MSDERLGASGHIFQFGAEEIARAARDRAGYHRQRETYWRDEFATSVARVKETAGVRVTEQSVTGGTRVSFAVDYGDLVAYERMREAEGKIERHRQEAERFESDDHVYGTQNNRAYELTRDDVHHFGLGGDQDPDL